MGTFLGGGVDRERAKYLLGRYEALVTPLLVEAREPKGRRRARSA